MALYKYNRIDIIFILTLEHSFKMQPYKYNSIDIYYAFLLSNTVLRN